jgi:ABC-2 type transport system ATP-binding protein
MPPKVTVRDLWKRYGVIDAVRGATFTVEPGEIFGLLGPNGAGKTTTLECLVGLREPDRGELRIGDHDVRRHASEAKQTIGVALQQPALPDAITPREALRMFGSFYRRRADPEALLARFALSDKASARFDSLSGGQRQRLALALALVNEPEVVLLDEPTAGLDPQARNEMHAEIAALKRNGATVLLTTHHLAEAEQLCDRVAILDHGRIVASGPPRDLVAQLHDPPVVTLVVAQPLDAVVLGRLPGVYELEVAGATARFRTRATNETLAALTRWLSEQRIEVVELNVGRASLEELFLALTRDAAAPEANSESRKP